MTSKALLILGMVFTPSLLLAQSPVARELGRNEVVIVDQEATPVNLDTLKVMIGYPPAAKAAKIEGKVIIRVMVDEQGNYIQHIVEQDPHPILTEAVVSKIPLLRCSPAIQKSKPIKASITIPIQFRLTGEESHNDQAKQTPAPTKQALTFSSLEAALACPDPLMVDRLYLNGQHLTAFPMEVLQFPNLRMLELKDNQLTKMPAEILTLKHLRMLDLSMNQLSSLPTELWDMANLKQIVLRKNAFDKPTQKLLEKEHGDKLFPKDEKGNVIW